MLTAQQYGRYVEERLAERFGWHLQRGSGNWWHHPSDAFNDRYQIEVKTFADPGHMRLNLAKVWTKIRQEAILVGREPLIVVALSVYSAWGVLPAWDWSISAQPVENVQGYRAWRIRPYCDKRRHRVYFEGELPPRFPVVWDVVPLEEVEDIGDPTRTD